MAKRRSTTGKHPAVPQLEDGEDGASLDRVTPPVRFIGRGVSPGVAIGPAYVLARGALHVPQRHLEPGDVEPEVLRLNRAVETSVLQLQELESRVHAPGGPEQATILQAYVLMLRDPEMVGQSENLIRQDAINAEWALRRTANGLKQILESMSDAYFRERGHDVDFVAERVLRNLLGYETDVPETVPEGSVVMAHDLSPADMLALGKRSLAGFVTEVGGPTSHTAIVARALCIPAVVAVPNATSAVAEGETVVVDGTRGEVMPRPSRMLLARYRGIRRQHQLAREELATLKDSPAITLDGHTVMLTANIELDDEVDAALEAGANGVGLYRTEYLFLHHRRVPTVDEQFASYSAVARALGPRPAVIRTYDLGGDKILPGHEIVDGRNAMGLRAVRLAFKEPQLMYSQLEAILRASVHGNVAIMLPMVGSVEELRQARAMLMEVRERLDAQDVPYDHDVKLGLMMELPSAVWVADHLARECDFFSIGTNDLIQYTLAVDRQDSHVAHLYAPLHPAILRAIRHTTSAAHDAGIKVSMCGEMAAEPAYSGVLMGLGLDELSMPAMALPRVKHMIRHWHHTMAKELATQVLECATVADVEALVTENQPEVDMHPGALKPSPPGPMA